MKLRLTTLTFLLIVSIGLFAQHNMNQKMFKENSVSRFRAVDKDNFSNISQDYKNSFQINGSSVQPVAYVRDNEVFLQVNALMNVKADRFLAVFNLTQIGETAAKTNDLMNARIDSFLNAAKKFGINSKDIYIDMIYMVPTYEYEVQKKLFSKTYNEVPTGFEMQKNIHISFKDINTIDDLVTMAARCEIYDLVKVDYFVENTEAAYDSLRNKAIASINKKVSALKKMNMVLSDKFLVVSEYSQAVYPESQYPDYDAFVSQTFEAVTKKTGVTNVRKPKTVAYDQLNYSKYHIIINPFILEPVVQFVYTLEVKYILEKPDVKSKNNYMLITPTGEVKKLELQP